MFRASSFSARTMVLLRFSLGLLVAVTAALVSSNLRAAEFGAGPWIKGATDIFAGVVPTDPGFYFRNDVYHYNASAERVIFNGRVSLEVSQDMTATLPALTYVSPFKLFGGTYAVGVVPSIMAVDVNVGLTFPGFTGPRGRTFEPLEIDRGDTNLALGDTGIIPAMLGWHEGNFYWSAALFALAPTGDYSLTQLANASLNHWSLMPRLAATYFDPKSGWQANGTAIYSINYENPDTDYRSGDILNLEGSLLKNFGALGLGVASYAMIQTTGDTGAGARLGSFESRVYAVGPILTFTTSPDPNKSLTILVKGFHEFGAKNTFEGDVIDAAVSFKF